LSPKLVEKPIDSQNVIFWHDRGLKRVDYVFQPRASARCSCWTLICIVFNVDSYRVQYLCVLVIHMPRNGIFHLQAAVSSLVIVLRNTRDGYQELSDRMNKNMIAKQHADSFLLLTISYTILHSRHRLKQASVRKQASSTSAVLMNVISRYTTSFCTYTPSSRLILTQDGL
jgi:hypothetical protein